MGVLRLRWFLVVAVGLGLSLSPERSDAQMLVLLQLWNRSGFELLDLRVHDGLSYQDSPNLVRSPIEDDEMLEVPFSFGQYVTVIRRRVEGGETIALTTMKGLPVDEEGFLLIVFQDSFRLAYPPGREPGDGCGCGGGASTATIGVR